MMTSHLLDVEGALQLAALIFIKGSIVLGIGIFVAGWCERRSPRAGHTVLSASFVVACLLIPLMAIMSPWRVSFIPGSDDLFGEANSFREAGSSLSDPVAAMPVGSGRETAAVLGEKATATPVATEAPVEAPWAQADEVRSASTSLGSAIATSFVLLWLSGALFLITRLLVGIVRIRSITATSTPALGHAQDTAQKVASDLGLRQVPSIRESRDVLQPAAWGFVNPVVLVPADSRHWDVDTWQAILLHECAHIRDHDYRALIAGQIAIAVYWMNAVAWWAHRRAGELRELGSDRAGTVEIAPLNAKPDFRRAEILVKKAQRSLFPGLKHTDGSQWIGARPFMPDTLPVIGPAPGVEDTWLAVGHGQLGVTMGPTTGKLVSAMITGRSPVVDLTPYRADRSYA